MWRSLLWSVSCCFISDLICLWQGFITLNTYLFTLPVFTFSFNVFFMIKWEGDHDYLHCRFSLKASKLWINTWTYLVNKKLWNNSKYVWHFRFFTVAVLCFVDSAANPRPSLSELHDVTWNGFHFTGVPCQDLWNFLPSWWGWDHQLCCEVRLVHSWQPYLTAVKIHIMARTNQLSKEKWQSIITLRTEGQSVWKIAKTLNVSPSAVAKTIKHYDETGSHEDRPRKGRLGVTSLILSILDYSFDLYLAFELYFNIRWNFDPFVSIWVLN